MFKGDLKKQFAEFIITDYYIHQEYLQTLKEFFLERIVIEFI